MLSGADISDIEEQIRNTYIQQDNPLSKDFRNIESSYCSLLPRAVSFQEFYGRFRHLFRKEKKFTEIVTLFCETVNGLRPLYNNALQQIAQLQTIFETLLGHPKKLRCCHCGMEHYVEDWDVFLEKRVKEYGITDPDGTRLMTKIKKKLNRAARVKYVHDAQYYNPNELRNIVADMQAGGKAEENSDISQLLAKKNDSWGSIDWLNAYGTYIVIVRNLIYLKYF